MKPPLAGWMGGKSKLCKTIVELIPEHVCYVEPFCGAAWILFNKYESKVEVINDINSDVFNLFNVLKYHLEEFLKQFKFLICSRETFKNELRREPDTLTDIQRAARFYYIHRMCFGGRMRNPSFGYAATEPPRLNLMRLEEEMTAAHIRLARVYVEKLDWSEIIRRYDRPGTFFYADPPYVGVEAVYDQAVFAPEDHAKLAEALGGIKGKFLLSQADTPEIRALYKGFTIESTSVRYTCGHSKRPLAREVLIRNYKHSIR